MIRLAPRGIPIAPTPANTFFLLASSGFFQLNMMRFHPVILVSDNFGAKVSVYLTRKRAALFFLPSINGGEILFRPVSEAPGSSR